MSWKIPVLIKLCPLMFVHDVTNFHVLNTSSKCDVKKNWKSTYVIFLIFWKPKWWCKFTEVLQRPKKHSRNRVKNINSWVPQITLKVLLKQTYFSSKRNELNEWVYFSSKLNGTQGLWLNYQNHKVTVSHA